MVNLNLKPKVKRMMTAFLAEAQKQGIRLLVTQGYRSKEEQDAIYAQGRTTKGKIVTQAKGGSSLHNFQVAFDVAGFDGKKVYYNINWKKLGKIANEIGLEHGDRGFVDLPHFQYRAGYSLKDFQTNKIDNNKFI